ncbi:MAG: oligosaccharide flippase family protein [Anaerolineaceae bacterium]|nr:oligosaccharide flippase family protein [Anaerolineaceae bacterium]
MIKDHLGSFWSKITDLKSFAGQVSLVMVTNIVIAIIGMGTGILSARILGPAGRGELAAIQTFPSFIAAMAMLGMPEAVVLFTSHKSHKSGEYLVPALMVVSILLIPIYGLGWFLLPVFLKAQSPQVLMAARIYMAGAMIAYTLAGLPHQLLRAVGSWKSWNIIRILPNMIWLMTLAAALFLPTLAAPFMLSQLFIVGQGLTLIPAWLLAKKHLTQPFSVNTQNFRPMLAYGLPAALSLLPQTLNLRMDQILMAAFLNPAYLGQYVVAVAWSTAASPILNAVGPVLFPSLSALADTTKKAKMLKTVISQYIILVIIVTFIILLATPAMIPLLFGEQFQQAVTPAIILVFANAILSLNTLFGDALKGMGLTGKVLTADLIGLVTTTILLLTLVPRYGIIGAAITSLMVYFFVCTILIYFIWFQFKNPDRNI